MGIREDAGPITGNLSSFVPLLSSIHGSSGVVGHTRRITPML